jgi:hypothetical protein
VLGQTANLRQVRRSEPGRAQDHRFAMFGHHAHMFKRSFRDGKLEQQVDSWYESIEIIDQRHAKRAQAHNFSQILAKRWMSRTLKPSCDLQIATLCHKVDKSSAHLPGCARNPDTHVCSPRQLRWGLVDCMVLRHRLPPPTHVHSLPLEERG